MGPKGGVRIGLALSGGGARGLAHIPVVEALDELGLSPAIIAGTSMGAIIGAGYAAGMSGADIRDFAIARLANRTEVLAKLWRLRPRVQQLLSEGGFAIARLDAERVLDVFMPEGMARSFGDLRVPLKVIATDFYGHRQAVFDTGSLFPALAASAAIPILFRPVKIGARIMVDGGIINPLPFDTLMDEADIVIAVDVVGAPVDRHHARMPGSFEAIYGATQLLMQAIMAEKMLGPRPPDIVLRPPVDVRVLEFYKVKQILDQARPVKDEIKRLVERALSAPRVREAVRSPGSR